ncbi:hypothetical protein [Helicobacter pylori]|uniref:hypothetical protein n=1 Tax=Helicobacter pylori TaxID=210 RepID=UPI0011847814|nr:hypothetical protein [Helicobacter pylori]
MNRNLIIQKIPLKCKSGWNERQEKIDDAQRFINKAQSWIKKKECTIDEILTHIQTIEPNYLLPQDFLYVGKLARVNKSEIYTHDGVKKKQYLWATPEFGIWRT